MASKPDRKQTRSRIIQTALELFWKDGYHAVSTDMVSRAAKVSKSSLYHAFASKELLAHATLDYVWQRDWQEISDIYAQDQSIEACFRAHLDSMVQAEIRLHAHYGAVMGSYDMALGVGVPDSVRDKITANYLVHSQRVQQSIQDILGAGTPVSVVDWLCEIILHQIGGARIRARLSNKMDPILRMPDAVFQLMETVRQGLPASS